MRSMRGGGWLLAAVCLLLAWPAAAQPAATKNESNEWSPAAARAALARLEAGAKRSLRLTWPKGRKAPSRVAGFAWQGEESAPEAVARAFVRAHGALVLATDESLRLLETEQTRGRSVVRFQQTWQGLEVLNATVTVVVDAKGRVRSMASTAQVVGALETTADVGAAAAVKAAFAAVPGTRQPAAEEADKLASLARKAVLASYGTRKVVYRVVVPTLPVPGKMVVLVDAATGEIVQKRQEVIR